MINTWCVRMGN